MTDSNRPYKYLTVFTWSGGNSRRSFTECEKPIDSFDRVEEVEAALEKNNPHLPKPISLTNFQLLSGPTEQPAAPAEQGEQEPAFEVQHGPLSDNDGEPEWVKIINLHEWDERNLPHGTKLFLSPQPATMPAKLALEAVRYAEEEGPKRPGDEYLDLVAEYIARNSQPAIPDGWSVALSETGEREGIASISGPGVYCMELPVRLSMFDFFAALAAAPEQPKESNHD